MLNSNIIRCICVLKEVVTTKRLTRVIFHVGPALENRQCGICGTRNEANMFGTIIFRKQCKQSYSFNINHFDSSI